MSNKERAPKKDKDENVKGWRAIDLSQPPSGPLQRSVTSMNGSEEPEWPLSQEDDEAADDEGDISEQ
jgi:hypothetical protein